MVNKAKRALQIAKSKAYDCMEIGQPFQAEIKIKDQYRLARLLATIHILEQDEELVRAIRSQRRRLNDFPQIEVVNGQLMIGSE